MIKQLIAPPDAPSVIECNADAALQAWLAQASGSLAIIAYQAGQLAFVSWNGLFVVFRLCQPSRGLAQGSAPSSIYCQ